MFNVGDEIECVDDSPLTCFGITHALNIKKGDMFVVTAVYAKGTVFDTSEKKMTLKDMSISIGVENRVVKDTVEYGKSHFILRLVTPIPPHYDIWPAGRFRKIEKIKRKDTKQAMEEIKNWFDTKKLVQA